MLQQEGVDIDGRVWDPGLQAYRADSGRDEFVHACGSAAVELIVPGAHQRRKGSDRPTAGADVTYQTTYQTTW